MGRLHAICNQSKPLDFSVPLSLRTIEARKPLQDLSRCPPHELIGADGGDRVILAEALDAADAFAGRSAEARIVESESGKSLQRKQGRTPSADEAHRTGDGAGRDVHPAAFSVEAVFEVGGKLEEGGIGQAERPRKPARDEIGRAHV